MLPSLTFDFENSQGISKRKLIVLEIGFGQSSDNEGVDRDHAAHQRLTLIGLDSSQHLSDNFLSANQGLPSCCVLRLRPKMLGFFCLAYGCFDQQQLQLLRRRRKNFMLQIMIAASGTHRVGSSGWVISGVLGKKLVVASRVMLSEDYPVMFESEACKPLLPLLLDAVWLEFSNRNG